MIQLKKIPQKNPKDGSTGYAFRQVYRSEVKDRDIAGNLQAAGSCTKGDALGIMTDLSSEIGKALASNSKVTIEGLGTFSLSVSSGMKAKKEDLKKSNVTFSVNFSPSDDILNVLSHADIKVIDTDGEEVEDNDSSDNSGGTDLEG